MRPTSLSKRRATSSRLQIIQGAQGDARLSRAGDSRALSAKTITRPAEIAERRRGAHRGKGIARAR